MKPDHRPGRRGRFLPLAVALASLAHGEIVVLNDDGAWNWLQDERALVIENRLVVASVALGHRDPARTGHIEVTTCDLRTRQVTRATLHREPEPGRARRWADDHSCPALVVRPDGRLLAWYSVHGQEPVFHYRVSEHPGDATTWRTEGRFDLGAGSRVTFPNLLHLSGENHGRGRMFAFFRGIENRLMPSWAQSEDGGDTWRAGGLLMQWPRKVTPYVKYAGNGRDAVHLAFTDGHRVDFNNAVYHAVYRDGQLHRSDGQRIATLAEGIRSPGQPTEIFRANADSVAMISDLELDRDGRPCVAYSVQLDTRTRRPRPVGADHRYRYARWNGTAWLDREIAFAGTETHDAPDDDCTGLIAIDPQDVNVVYVSSNADPTTGAPLVSRADGRRHWEIFRGRTRDAGVRWQWEPLTRDSTADNLRPIVPSARGRPAPVLWLRGAMRMPRDSAMEVVAWLPERE